MKKLKLFFKGIFGRAFRFAFKWTKRAMWLGVFILIAALIALAFIDDIAKAAINNSAEYVDLKAGVEKVKINLLTQKIVFKNISIKNPDGFPEGDAFSAGVLEIKYGFDGGKPRLERIYMRGAKARVEGRRGRRITAASATKSNMYVIARELGRIFDVKIESLFMPAPKSKKPADAKAADAVKDFDYAKVREFLKRYEDADEIRIENLEIQNGEDSYLFGSIICNDKIALANDFHAKIFGVKFGVRGVFLDLSKPAFGLSGFMIANPDGYPKNPVFSIGKIFVSTREEVSPDGKTTPRLESVKIDSPTIHFEDKSGSMLGAIGMDNNFAGIYKTVDSMTHTRLGDLFQDEFEVVPEMKEFNLPEIPLENITITNARIVAQKKDAGLLANKISVERNKVCVDDVRAHFGGVKLELAGVVFDSEKQSFDARDFTLRNPAGFPEESAFRFKNFHVDTNFTERVIRGNRVLEIGDIEVNKFFVRLDSRSGDIVDLLGDDNNLFALLGAVSASSALMPVNSKLAEKSVNEDKT
ncbi:MAG: hypothetical protein IJI37_02390, partial [Opitutales bacterium]|nr:hypothetical protein [Opitutales bacterium]